jgi:hypothetical protein
MLGTRQTLCQVSFGARHKKVVVTAISDGDRNFAECNQLHSGKRNTLPSACWPGTRQKNSNGPPW